MELSGQLRGNGYKLRCRRIHLNIRKTFSCESGQTLEKVDQRGLWSLFQNLTGCMGERCWTGSSLEVPSNLSHGVKWNSGGSQVILQRRRFTANSPLWPEFGVGHFHAQFDCLCFKPQESDGWGSTIATG